MWFKSNWAFVVQEPVVLRKGHEANILAALLSCRSSRVAVRFSELIGPPSILDDLPERRTANILGRLFKIGTGAWVQSGKVRLPNAKQLCQMIMGMVEGRWYKYNGDNVLELGGYMLWVQKYGALMWGIFLGAQNPRFPINTYHGDKAILKVPTCRKCLFLILFVIRYFPFLLTPS